MVGPLWIYDLMLKRGQLIGSTIRGRTHAEKAALAQDIAPTMVPLPARGLVRVAVDSAFPPDRYRDAYDRLAEAGKLGKVILTCE
ncbi:hypothetical protein [Streptomyces sp. NBC_00564]|uniref:hypothetical protein n=1 Tax=Streptomyces sp. NBC_00564 TaxID=2903663 RepID=UPI002FCD9BD7|nr:hypothetical protein OG256_44945 [Streptomyces sp. NBC_00564]